jgi:poly(A) polymerase
MKLQLVVPLNVGKVIRRLKRYDHQAYLVGGCVRDALIGRTPKDYDIATDATPEEVHDIFDNSRIVGRRFPIAHVCFQGQIIEVVTFRDEENRYGTLTDDVYRRDFTANALYWDEGEVIDPFSGLEDIERREVVCIGKPDQRFMEDPVRMLRAARLIQLGFTLSADVKSSIDRNSEMLRTVNKSRLFCEFAKAFQGQCPMHVVLTLEGLGLMRTFFPRTMYGEVTLSADDQDVSAIICSITWTYFCDLVGSCMRDFSLHPIPASQKAAKLLVERLKGHMDVDRVTALAIKEELYLRYRASECT